MTDPNERDAKLIQYLSEAYGKERELEVALQVDIAMTTKAPRRLCVHHQPEQPARPRTDTGLARGFQPMTASVSLADAEARRKNALDE